MSTLHFSRVGEKGNLQLHPHSPLPCREGSFPKGKSAPRQVPGGHGEPGTLLFERGHADSFAEGLRKAGNNSEPGTLLRISCQ